MTRYIKIAVYNEYGYLIPKYIADYDKKYNYDNFDDIWQYIYEITDNKRRKIIKLNLYYSDKWEPITIITINNDIKYNRFAANNDSDELPIYADDIRVIDKDMDADYLAYIEYVKEYIRSK